MNSLMFLVAAVTLGDDTLTPPADGATPDTLTPPAAVFATPDTLTPPAPPAVEVTAPAADYAACVSAVDAGRVVTLSVGTAAPDAGDFYVRELTGLAPGRYVCWRTETGERKMQLQPEQVVQQYQPQYPQASYGVSCPGGVCPR